MRQVKAWIGTPTTNENFKRNLAVVIAIIIGLPTIYIATHLETTPYTDRLRFVALTSDDEMKIGELTFSQLVEEHETNFIPDHHHFVSHVTQIAMRIIEATERPDIQWEVRLIDSPITNAFAIPGGKIFVFSGLLDVTKNDDGLAFILGHEVAHVLARHGAEQMAVGKVMLGVSVLVSALFGDNIGSFILGRLLSWLTELSYSRNMEREADYIGLVLMNNAKFNVEEAPKVWERMMQANPDDSSPYLSTHPSHSERIADITKWIGEIKQRDQERVLTTRPSQVAAK
jgi:predicted Zn-dependent protease